VTGGGEKGGKGRAKNRKRGDGSSGGAAAADPAFKAGEGNMQRHSLHEARGRAL
jgi:hypothetical protein